MWMQPAKGHLIAAACNRLIANSIEVVPIFNTAVRCFSVQTATPISPSSSSYDDLINAAGRQRDFATVRRLVTKRVIEGFFNTNSTFNFISADLSVIPELLQNLAVIEDWFARKHAHDALVAKLALLYRTTEAMDVAQTMVKNKYGATPTTFLPILKAMARKKDMKEAWSVMEVMRVCNVKPNLAAFNYILTAYCSLGHLTSAADVLVKLEKEGFNADVRTYDALVLGACRGHRLEVALRLMGRMLGEAMSPLYSTHGHIIKEMIKSGYYAQAILYVKIFARMDEKLDAQNFVFLARSLMNAKQIDEAKSIFEEIKKRGLPSNQW